MALALYYTEPGSFESISSLFLKGALFLDNVLIYIAALEILKGALNKRKVMVALAYMPADFSYSQTRLLAMVSAFPFGLGVSSFLKGLSDENINTKPISEGMTTSMLMYPTTLASSFVFDCFQLTSLSALILFGLPLVLLMLLPLTRSSLLTLIKSSLFKMVVLVALVNYVYLVVLSQLIEQHYMLKQAAFFVLFAFVINIKIVSKIPVILWGYRSVFIFFVCVGILGYVFVCWVERQDVIHNFERLSIYAAIAVPIFIIPLLSVLFIHPLILFVIFNPLLTPCLQAYGIGEFSLYGIWVVMLINSQLLSPVSLTTVLSVSNSNSNLFSESFLKHGAYTLKVSVLAYGYFLLVLNFVN
jgi:hypothetical protein